MTKRTPRVLRAAPDHGRPWARARPRQRRSKLPSAAEVVAISSCGWQSIAVAAPKPKRPRHCRLGMMPNVALQRNGGLPREKEEGEAVGAPPRHPKG